MATSGGIHPRLASGLLAGGLLLIALAGCSGTPAGDAPGSTASTASTGSTAAPAGTTAPGPETAGSSGSGSTGAGNSDTGVHCSGASCSVTLSGDGASAEVLGTTIGLQTVANGRATLGVGDHDVSCSQGESVSAGLLRLECSSVTADGVTLTASLG